MGSGHGIISATLLVNDLKKTRDYYADTLGFEMPTPDKFDTDLFDGAVTTSINFADYSMLEFLSVADTAVVKSRYAYIESFLDHYQGVRTYSISSSSADTTNTWLTSQGFKTDSVRTFRTSSLPPVGWDWDDGGPEIQSVEFDSMQPPAYLPLVFKNLLISSSGDCDVTSINSWLRMSLKRAIFSLGPA